MTNAPIPPQNVEAEDYVLGAMLLSPNAIGVVADELDPTDFYKPSNALIYRAILDLDAKGEPADALTVVDTLQRAGKLEAAGGRVRVHELPSLAPASANAAHHARLVRDAAQLRRLADAGRELVRLATERPGETPALLDQAEQAVYRLTTGRETADLSLRVGETFATLTRLRDNPQQLLGVPSGYKALDELTQGFQPGQLIIVAARPSMGKSALATGIIAKLLAADQPVALFTLEMSKAEVTHRLVASGGALPLRAIQNPSKLTETQWQDAQRIGAMLEHKPFYVRETGTLAPLEFRAQVRRLKARVPLSLVIVDYLQLMSNGAKTEHRVQEVSQISRELKATARDLNVPIVALSQLSRAVEMRTDKRPILSDLRESGAIEQDADIVCFLYRDSYYHKPSEPLEVEWVEVNVAKHRNGPTDTISLLFRPEMARFENPQPIHLVGDVAA